MPTWHSTWHVLPSPISSARISERDSAHERSIQSSAAISPVNYGGPLVAIDGAVFGLLVPLSPRGGMAGVGLYDSGIGFAIPAPDLLRLAPKLAGGADLKAAYIGLVPDDKHRDGGVRVAVASTESDLI